MLLNSVLIVTSKQSFLEIVEDRSVEFYFWGLTLILWIPPVVWIIVINDVYMKATWSPCLTFGLNVSTLSIVDRGDLFFTVTRQKNR